MTKQPGHPESRQLGGKLLASVSRSFYLSIKVLPPEVREQIGLAYLLARTTDTIADTATVPAVLRLKHLQALSGMIEGGADNAKIELLQKEIVPANKAEQKLLGKLGPCMEWLAAQPEEDHADIVDVLEKIICGQELDIVRFPHANDLHALQDAAELDEYTYLVAGCVGEFWTRICYRHLKLYAAMDEEALCKLGINFGKGLQLVNILRDLPADLRSGRCYLPANQLAGEGVNPKKLRESAEQARPVFDRWLAKATAHLDDAFRYIEALSSTRVRIACILPWAIGMKTLVLLTQKYPLATSERVKVTRAEIRKLLFLAPVAAMSNWALHRMRAKFRKSFVLADD